MVLISFCTNNPIDVHVRCRGDLLESTLTTMALPRDCHVATESVAPRNDIVECFATKTYKKILCPLVGHQIQGDNFYE